VEEIFDLMWRLDTVQTSKEGLAVACALRLWEFSFDKSPLQACFSSQLTALAEKQEVLQDDEKMLAARLQKMTLTLRFARVVRWRAATPWEQQFPSVEHFHESMNDKKHKFSGIETEVDRIMRNVEAAETNSQMDRVDAFSDVAACGNLLRDFFGTSQDFVAMVHALPNLLDNPCNSQDDGGAHASILQHESARTRVQNILEDILRVVGSLGSATESIQRLICKDLRVCLPIAGIGEVAGSVFDDHDELIDHMCSRDESQKEKLRAGIHVIIALRLSLAGMRDIGDNDEAPSRSSIPWKHGPGLVSLYKHVSLEDAEAEPATHSQ
jgi:hypothetical protein